MINCGKYKMKTRLNDMIFFFFFFSSLTKAVSTNEPPILLQSSKIIVKPEDTKVGDKIGVISAKDSDGPRELEFFVQTGDKLVNLSRPTGSSSSGRSVNIILVSPLDRDWAPQQRNLVFRISDGLTSVTRTVTLYIQDVNDNAPEFRGLPYKATVPENAAIGSLIKSVTTFDPDNGPGGSVTYSMQAIGQSGRPEYHSTFRIDPINGKIRLVHSLDYEAHTFYQFEIVATDGGNLSKKADFVVTVLDIQDTPPYFVNLPYSKQIPENISVDSPVMQVTGLDGDRGVSNNLTYKFVHGQTAHFKIDPDTGWISVKSRLDRDEDTLRNTGGVYAMTVMAEESNQIFPQLGNVTANTLVTITVMDVNDKAPTFNRKSYVASVLENMQKGMPISFTKGNIMTVYDRDEGANSHFVLTVEKDGREFFDVTPLPQEVFGEATVILRVNNSEMLDYETTKEIEFQVVAREVDTPEKRSSSATVLLQIQDMNDNAPAFRSDSYDLHVRENARIGTVISQITATDADTGVNGRVSYYLKGAMKRFQVSASNGVIFVSDILDREFRDAYYMTLEARDGGGFRTTVPLTIYIDDVNDNAPHFRRQEHAEIIREGQPFFSRSLVVEAKDFDKMGTLNSRVKYKIVEAVNNLTENFTIDEFRGEISLNGPLDYEGLDPDLNGKIIITVMAYDMGIPPMNSTTNVTVTVEDENDNVPVFDKKMYFAHIAENSPPGTSVTKIRAHDADITSPNNEVIYRIDSGAFDKFRIDAVSGILTVEKGAILDREMMAKYQLNVSAIDRGTPSNHGKCQVIIYIGDVNDESPFFDKPTNYLTVMENQTIGMIIHTVSAKDNDLGAHLEYYILSDRIQAFNDLTPVPPNILETIKSHFGIYSNNGSIYIKTPPDREEADQVILPVLVKDLNAWKSPKSQDVTREQTATVILTITVLDANDNPPDFLPSKIYRVNVSEGVPLDTEVLTVKATDKDKNQKIWFRIGYDPMATFKIKSSESYTGIIRLQRQLDREEYSNITFTVLAIDEKGPHPLTSTATVYVNVVDMNDNRPRFITQEYVYSVYENAKLNTLIATIKAVDDDNGAYGKVHYSLETTDQDLPFRIDEDTGKLVVSGPIDRETRSAYTMGVVAKDNKNFPNKQRSTHERITVNVIDVNDNTPVFQQTGKQLVQLQEVEAVGSGVYTVSASDADEGRNGKVFYSLEVSHADRGLFRINSKNGKIKVNRSLKDKIGMHNVTVIAMDAGIPRQSSKMKVYFEILDVNLHNPKFIYPVEGVKLLIPEGDGPNSVVMQVNATDEDHGYNGEVRYFLLRDADWQKFDLDQTTGILTTRYYLDREVQKSYTLHIKATDSGKPPRAVTTTLHIEIQDSNDNAPEFDRKKYPFPYKLYGREEKQTALVGSVAIAEDRDSAENSIICYYIIGGEMIDHFWLNQTSGGLYIQKSIDREKHGAINLLINATNTCFQRSLKGRALYPEDFYKREITHSSYLWVQVVITDINDNPPKFRRKHMSVGVTRDTDFGTTIFELQYEVDDPDIGDNSVHAFQQIGAIRISESLRSMMTRDPVSNRTRQPFIVSSNGSVITNMFFQPNMHGSFVLPILVTDGVHSSDTADLTINFVSDSQRLKVIFRRPPLEVQKIKEKFLERLQNITGLNIIIDRIKTHRDSEGNPEVKTTDMFIHGLKMNSNQVLEARELLRLIDYNTAHLVGILNDYNIIEIVPSYMKRGENSEIRDAMLVLILIAFVLLVILFVIVTLFYISRQKYKRKLKAARNENFISHQASQIPKGEIPGTNQHTVENDTGTSYHLWLAYDRGSSLDNYDINPRQTHVGFDEQELSVDMYNDDVDYMTKTPVSVLSSSDVLLDSALREHEASKNTRNKHSTFYGELPAYPYVNGTAILSPQNLEHMNTTDI